MAGRRVRYETRTTTERGLGWDHQQRRRAMLPAALGTLCPVRGPRCDRLMVDPRRMHLDHSTPRALGGTVGDRIICAPCNLSRGGKLGRSLQVARRAAARRRQLPVW